MNLLACVGAHLKQEFLSEGTVLDVSEDLLHSFSGLICDDLGTCDIVAVLSCVGDGISHSCETGLIDQVDDQLHLVYALEICVAGIVACLYQSLETCLHQSADAAAEDSLLAEQIGLGLCPESGLKDTCAGSADTCAIGKSLVQSLARSILIYSDEGRSSLACLVLAADSVSGSLGSDHCDVNICRRLDQTEMNVEAVSKHEHIAGLEVGLDVLLVHSCLLLIVDQDHDDVRHLSCLSSIVNRESLSLSLSLGLGSLIKAYDNIASGLLEVECMRMTLAAVADNCDCLAFQY